MEDLDTPALLIDYDKLRANIDAMAATLAGTGIALRPHAKTHKMPQVAKLQIAAGSPGLTVAKLGEAEVMAAAGIRDLFVAYPIVGEQKLERLTRLAAANDIRVAADSWDVLAGIDAAAARRGLRIDVLLEVDSGFGRCGLQTPADVLALARRAQDLRGVRVIGLMGFGGHSYGAASEDDIARIARSEATQLVELAQMARAEGIDLRQISIGSTPTSRYAAATPGVTEARPGNYVFSDRIQAGLGWRDLDACALTVLTTVVSRPTLDRAVVDVGSKGLSSDTAPEPGYGHVIGQPAASVETLTEEHGILRVADGRGLPVGAKLRIIPNHACAALNLFDHAWIVADGRVEDRWPVAARGKMQ
ncbi:MAG TPA: alanine racemase [Thermomicrobiales bacterium]|nr:alanine racemase [Thermomicrobiales bacterium]